DELQAQHPPMTCSPRTDESQEIEDPVRSSAPPDCPRAAGMLTPQARGSRTHDEANAASGDHAHGSYQGRPRLPDLPEAGVNGRRRIRSALGPAGPGGSTFRVRSSCSPRDGAQDGRYFGWTSVSSLHLYLGGEVEVHVALHAGTNWRTSQ